MERASSQEPAEKPVPLIRRLLSGMYSIDPDGQGVGDAPNYVHCDIQTGRIGKLNIKITSIISCFTHFYLPGTSERHQSLMTATNRRWTWAITSIPDVIPGPSITTQQVIKSRR